LNVFVTIHFTGVPMAFLYLYEIANFIVLYLYITENMLIFCLNVL
jgi:hypothetical protein